MLPLLIVGQVALHAAMAGQRMAAPLQALQAGHSAWAVGVLLALFAALPVLTAMASGRMADRHGYHRPLRVAVALTMVGAACALAACWLPMWWRFALLCVGAACSGVGTNVGLIAIQRTASHLAGSSTERLRVFSWLGMAPSLANVVGPVAAGFMWDLLAVPGFKRLLFVNWLLSASWDVHSFAVPVLGHARGYSASTIGLVLGTFTAAVTLVRFAIPMLAHRLQEVTVLRSAMLIAAAVFAVYPLGVTPWWMAGCALVLGLALGCTQPMMMSTLHHLTPAHRQGEAIAFRSAALNLSSSVMPLAFGLAGTALGPGVLFWLMGAAGGTGSQ
ncbi:MAG: MFS transporter, partial [Burkholderiales bacterium PBB5]